MCVTCIQFFLPSFSHTHSADAFFSLRSFWSFLCSSLVKKRVFYFVVKRTQRIHFQVNSVWRRRPINNWKAKNDSKCVFNKKRISQNNFWFWFSCVLNVFLRKKTTPARSGKTLWFNWLSDSGRIGNLLSICSSLPQLKAINLLWFGLVGCLSWQSDRFRAVSGFGEGVAVIVHFHFNDF